MTQGLDRSLGVYSIAAHVGNASLEYEIIQGLDRDSFFEAWLCV